MLMYDIVCCCILMYPVYHFVYLYTLTYMCVRLHMLHDYVCICKCTGYDVYVCTIAYIGILLCTHVFVYDFECYAIIWCMCMYMYACVRMCAYDVVIRRIHMYVYIISYAIMYVYTYGNAMMNGYNVLCCVMIYDLYDVLRVMTHVRSLHCIRIYIFMSADAC